MIVKLGEVFSIIRNGANIKQGVVDGGFPITRIETISEKFVDRAKMGYAGIEQIDKYSEYVMQDGDILMSHINSEKHLGKTAIYKKECDEVIIHGMNLLLLRPINELILSKYAFYFLSSQAFLRQIPNITKKSVNQASFNITALKGLDFVVTSLERQEIIIETLEKIEKIIASRKQQLQKLDELVKARFVEMFGDPNTNMMGWRKEQLQLNASLLNGRAYKQDELLDDGKYPVLRVGNFFSNRGWYYSDLELEEDKYCDNGDLLYAWSASFGPKIWNGGKVIYHYHIWKVLVGEKYNKKFLCHLLDYATASFMGDTHGIGMMHLTKSGMEQTEFIVPPMELQEQFATFVEQTDKSKFAVQKALDEAQTLFDSLMQEYFG